MADAPSVTNYTIGKGVVSFKKTGAPSYRDLGNVPTLEFTPTIETLDHFSSRSGVREKDLTVVLQKAGTLRMVMEEFDAENMALMLLGTSGVDASGYTYIDIFSESQISGELQFIGTNDVGRLFQLDLLKVDFIPGSSVSFISDEWGQLEITGQVAAVAGQFGTLKFLDEQTSI